MNSQKYYLGKILLLGIMVGFPLLTVGCGKSPASSKTPPSDYATGKAGTMPDSVYQEYDWVIMSQERYKQ